jgi:hypothetical protein
VHHPKREITVRKIMNRCDLHKRNPLPTVRANTHMKKRKPPTESQRAAGRQNLIAFNKSRGGRPAAKHGIHSFVAGAPLSDALRSSLEAWKADLISDLGNEPTAAERALVDSACIARGVLLLGHEWMARNGVIDRRGRPAQVLKVLSCYMNSMRLCLTTLGLERRVKRVNDLESIAVEYATKAATPVPAATEVSQVAP